jgi:hypothetical protein
MKVRLQMSDAIKLVSESLSAKCPRRHIFEGFPGARGYLFL